MSEDVNVVKVNFKKPPEFPLPDILKLDSWDGMSDGKKLELLKSLVENLLGNHSTVAISYYAYRALPWYKRLFA